MRCRRPEKLLCKKHPLPLNPTVAAPRRWLPPKRSVPLWVHPPSSIRLPHGCTHEPCCRSWPCPDDHSRLHPLWGTTTRVCCNATASLAPLIFYRWVASCESSRSEFDEAVAQATLEVSPLRTAAAGPRAPPSSACPQASKGIVLCVSRVHAAVGFNSTLSTDVAGVGAPLQIRISGIVDWVHLCSSAIQTSTINIIDNLARSSTQRVRGHQAVDSLATSCGRPAAALPQVSARSLRVDVAMYMSWQLGSGQITVLPASWRLPSYVKPALACTHVQ